jgi:hypothetical protein
MIFDADEVQMIRHNTGDVVAVGESLGSDDLYRLETAKRSNGLSSLAAYHAVLPTHVTGEFVNEKLKAKAAE